MRRSLRALATTIATTVAVVGLVPAAALAIDLDIELPPPPTKPETAVRTWYSGTVEPGETHSGGWNTRLSAAYHIGLSPVGATTSEPCEFEVVKTWYQETTSGRRQFRWTVKNIGDVACATNIILSRIDTTSIGSTRGVSPGGTVELVERGLDTNSNYLVGLIPSGATSDDDCRFQVVGTSYRHYRQGDVATYLQARVTVENIGNVACTADVRLASIITDATPTIGSLAAGASTTKTYNNANPIDQGYLAGVIPNVGCELAVTRTYYRQRINSNGSAEREFVRRIKNLSSTTCNGKSALTTI
ncbi:MAG TPA: hypothetical protein VFO77_15045 [Actinoplanes sp.]|nr:hypothetical protein [Actinoplanes sp.]